MYNAKQIANWFIRRARVDGKLLSIMQILKLVYISHGWHLEMFGAPLFRNRIEAWEHGPVIPDVYRAFRGQGVAVKNEVEVAQTPLASHEESLLEDIYRIYGAKGPFELSDMTHVPGGPWDTVRKAFGLYAPISDALILNYYKDLRVNG